MNDEELKELQRQAAKFNEALARVSGERKVVLFAAYAGAYLVGKLSNPTLRDSTKRAFTYQIRNHLIPGFGELPLEQITNASFLRWVIEMRAKGQVTRFFNARKCLIEVLTAAKNDGAIEKIPKFDNPDEPKNVGRALTDREVLKILRNCYSDFFRFFFFCLWKTGCRPREVLRWEWDMIAWNEPGHTWIDIPARISKTARSRKIPLNPAVSRRLHWTFENTMRQGSKYIFPSESDSGKPQLSYNSAWTAACARAGVQAVPYDLRRSMATKCAAAGMPLLYVAKCLDTSVKMLENIYAKEAAETMESLVK